MGNKRALKMKTPNFKMSELCEKTGYSRTTIYQYLKIGLLHSGKKVGFKTNFYDATHVDVLNKIRFLKKEKGTSISDIRKALIGKEQYSGVAVQNDSTKKNIIMDKGIRLFSQNGYSGVSIRDLTTALDISKGTFYLHFKSKKSFFLECIERLTTLMIPKQRWDEIREKTDPIERTKKRVEVFLDGFHNWTGILDLVRYAIRNEDIELSQKGNKALNIIMGPCIKDYRWSLKQGVVKEVDEVLYGYFYVAMNEAMGYAKIINSKYTQQELLDTFASILYSGISSHCKSDQNSSDDTKVPCRVTDVKGVETTINNFRISGKDFFDLSHGSAKVRVFFRNILSVRVTDHTSRSLVLMLKNDEESNFFFNEGITLSGECIYGEFFIYLDELSQIIFLDGSNNL